MDDMNKKLLRFAGFTCSNSVWCYPDGIVIENGLPNFTKSLDACLKWLTPKLDRITLEWDSYAKDMWWVRVNGEYDADDKTLALALCNAILKLLEANNEMPEVS